MRLSSLVSSVPLVGVFHLTAEDLSLAHLTLGSDVATQITQSTEFECAYPYACGVQSHLASGKVFVACGHDPMWGGVYYGSVEISSGGVISQLLPSTPNAGSGECRRSISVSLDQSTGDAYFGCHESSTYGAAAKYTHATQVMSWVAEPVQTAYYPALHLSYDAIGEVL